MYNRQWNGSRELRIREEVDELSKDLCCASTHEMMARIDNFDEVVFLTEENQEYRGHLQEDDSDDESGIHPDCT